jgi:hypothetical protein
MELINKRYLVTLKHQPQENLDSYSLLMIPQLLNSAQLPIILQQLPKSLKLLYILPLEITGDSPPQFLTGLPSPKISTTTLKHLILNKVEMIMCQ